MRNLFYIIISFMILITGCNPTNQERTNNSSAFPTCDTSFEFEQISDYEYDYDITFDDDVSYITKDREGVLHERKRYGNRRFVIKLKQNNYVDLLVYNNQKLIQKHKYLILTGNKSRHRISCVNPYSVSYKNLNEQLYLKNKNDKEIFNSRVSTYDINYPSTYHVKYDKTGNGTSYETITKEMMRPFRISNKKIQG
jgi:hypothetical protein